MSIKALLGMIAFLLAVAIYTVYETNKPIRPMRTSEMNSEQFERFSYTGERPTVRDY